MAEKRQPAGGLGRFRLNRLLKAVWYSDQGRLLGVPADTAETSPLRDLVAEVAGAIRVGVPESVLVSPYAEIAIAGDDTTGMTLYVGAALVLGLPVVELKAVLAHAMASLAEPYPELADAVVRTALPAEDFVDSFGPTSSLGRRYQKFLDDSAQVRKDLGRHADRAAGAVAGSQEQARKAMARSRAIARHLEEFLPRYLLADDESPDDCYTNWLRAAAQPVPAWAVQSQRAVDPLIPPDCVPLVASLDRDDVFELLTAVDVDPDAAYNLDYDATREEVLAAATVLLGQDATPADVVRLIADGRGAELAAQWDEVTDAQLAIAPPHTRGMERYLAETRTAGSTPGELLEAFLPGLAVLRGYHYDPVVHPGVLTAEDRPGIEIYETIGSAVAGDTTALAGLVTDLVADR